MSKACIIDGNSLMFRAFWATYNQLDYYHERNLFPTNAIYTIVKMFLKIINNNCYNYAVIAFDHKDENFRKQNYSEYKKNRKKIHPDLVVQIPIIHKISQLFGFNFFCISGIEADDVIGTGAKFFSENNIDVDIYSSDKDMLQLINENTRLNFLKKGVSEIIVYDLNNFGNLNEGLSPKQIIDYKAIAGDSSDNICGIKGIGHKSALDLIKTYDSLESIYNNIDKIEKQSIKKKLIDSKDLAFMFKDLVTIKNDVIDLSKYDLKLKLINNKEMLEIIDHYQLKSLRKYFL